MIKPANFEAKNRKLSIVSEAIKLFEHSSNFCSSFSFFGYFLVDKNKTPANV